MLHESDFNEYKTNTAATLGTMQTSVNSLTDLTAGFPEGKTIKNYVDDSITVVTGEISGLYGDTLALGKGSKATGTNSIAIGFSNKVSGKNSGAFGDPNDVSGSGSYAFGNNNTVSGDNTFVLGNNIKTSAKNAVVLGDGSEGADNAVSVGAKGKERQIKNVAPGTDDTDATTVKQVKEMIEAGGGGADLTPVNHRIDNLDSKINKVGAGAAALSALHPMDTDSKFGIAVGFGNYRDANAMALGMFYRPTDRVMLSIGGTMGNGENMLNAGVSFALDKGVTTSKAAMARTIKAQGEEIAALKEAHEKENAEHKAEIQALKEALARLEAKIGK
jgi:autotransporter adhesin